MSKPEKKLFLLDAMALIYRAHFAFSKNPRITSTGMNTSATFGFTNTLLEVLNKEKPTHIAVAFDTAKPTFRHERFPAYKAQREAQPEDIKVAIPYVKRIVEAFNIPVLVMDGFEADDIIGSIAKRCAREDFEVFMMTPDKDYCQLVEEHVYLYKPSYMGNGVDVLGVPEVLAKYDIDNVDQVRDLLGLQGDASDNIPGVPGVGPKTACKLLKEYGTVENLLQNTDKLKGKLRENLETFAEQGLLSKELATIKTDMDISCTTLDLEYSGPDEERVKAVFDELEFRTLMRRVLGGEETATATQPVRRKKAADPAQQGLFDVPAPAKEEEETAELKPLLKDQLDLSSSAHDYHLIDTPELRRSLAKHLSQQEEFCFDTETDSLDVLDATLVGIAFSYLPGEGYYVPCPEDGKSCSEILQDFREVFENENIRKVGQNLKYDIGILRTHGVEVKGPLFDTMLAHYLLEPDMRHNMDGLASSYLNYRSQSITELIGKKGKNQGNMRTVDMELVKEYAAEDADVTLQLKNYFEPLLNAQGVLRKLFDEVEIPLLRVLESMEREGIRLDTDSLTDFSKELGEEIQQLEKDIHILAGENFNIASPKQLGEILFDKMKLANKPKKTKTGQYATGEDILSRLQSEHDIIKKILDYRELVKLKNTYVDALPGLIAKTDGRIHTSYNQAVAATGRLSSTNPNLQNIPIRTDRGREIRKAFVARDESFALLAADYSQIELRIMADFSGDESMIAAFTEGRDIHATTAAKVFQVPLDEVDSDMRRKAKMVNFGIIYGISPFGLAQRLDISRTEAAEIIDAYFKEFPAVKEYMDRVVNTARENGYVETVMGRRRYLADINSRNATLRGYAERNAINAPIQGSAADMIKVAMVNIHKWMETAEFRGHPLKSKMLLQVHDELIFDAQIDEAEMLKENVERFMREAIPLKVPLEIGSGFGSNWLEAH